MFNIFSQNEDCGYTLVPHRRGGSTHWVLPWSRYKKVLFAFLVADFVLLH